MLVPTVVELQGGLGNQLFQLAFALELRARGHHVALNAGAISADRGLQVAGLLPPDVKLSHDRQPSRGPVAALTYRLAGGPRLVQERSLAFSHSMINLSSSRSQVLRGYWQSERYFPTVADEFRSRVLKEFSTGLTPAGQRLSEWAQSNPSASLHVRRGDYVTNAAAAATHGVLPMSYYDQAVDRLGAEVQVYVFSDDLDWARAAFSGDRFRFVDGRHSVTAAGELALMSAFSVHIVANSSFSWWGAWLGGPDHTVISPRKWFADDHLDDRDIVPGRWLRI